MYGRRLGIAGIIMGAQGIIVTGVGATMMLFYYLICDRALLGQAMSAVVVPDTSATDTSATDASGDGAVEPFRNREGFRRR